MMHYELSRAIIADRQEAARRAGERARVLSEARAARDERAGGSRPRAVIARGIRALRRAPAT